MNRRDKLLYGVMIVLMYAGAAAMALFGVTKYFGGPPAQEPKIHLVQWLGFPVSGFPDAEGRVNTRAFYENQIGLREDGVVVWRTVDAQGQ